MTRISSVSLSLALSVFIVLGVGCDKVDDEVQGGLTVEPQHFYLPPDKEMATPVFSLVNNSSTVIHILDIKSSCGCASPKVGILASFARAKNSIVSRPHSSGGGSQFCNGHIAYRFSNYSGGKNDGHDGSER